METTPDLASFNIDSLPMYFSDQWNIDFENPLGKGGFSIGVYRGKKLDGLINDQIIPNDGECVIKVIEQEQIGKYEIDTLDQLIKIEHDNIIKTYGYAFGKFEDKNCLFIYMEYLEGYRTIADIIKQEKKIFTEEQISKVTKNLIDCLVELYKYHIIHRDIKGDNILVNQIDGSIKLIDFGVSKFFGDNDSKYQTLVGTSTHIAPEVIYNGSNGTNKPSSKSDVWSVGCTIIEMAGGDLTKKNGGVPIIPQDLSDNCKNFVQYCLVLQVENRKKARELITHEFIKSEDINIYDNSSLITHLTLPDFNQPLEKLVIPAHITNLTLPIFNQPIKLNSIPPNIQSLSLPSFNHQIEENSLPSTLSSFSITSFNHEVLDEAIPESITELKLGESFDFNENGGNLPSTILNLSCSYIFKSSLKKNNNIPKKVITLVLDNYNHPVISGCLLDSIQTLQLGSNFTHFESLKFLPKNIFNLTFGVGKDCSSSDSQIKKFIPPTVSKIIINRN